MQLSILTCPQHSSPCRPPYQASFRPTFVADGMQVQLKLLGISSACQLHLVHQLMLAEFLMPYSHFMALHW